MNIRFWILDLGSGSWGKSKIQNPISGEELLQPIHEALQHGEGALDGFRGSHVDARELEGVQGVEGAAGLEEALVVLRGLGSLLEHPLGQGVGGGYAGGVLVDVEV